MPLIIMVGSLLPLLFPNVWITVAGLLITGFGVGGGYSLDESYISEIMPDKWRMTMVGIAKGTCALGFIAAAGIAFLVLKADPNPHLWNYILLIIAAMGLITLLLRIRWQESPRWLMLHGRTVEAQQAAKFFLGPDAEALPLPAAKTVANTSWLDMFRGDNLTRVIYSGIPWACEGLGVYGIGVFLPVLVMALGIDSSHATGINKIINSVELTTVINFFILPGFALGLWWLRKLNHVVMLAGGFAVCAMGLILLLVGYLTHLPAWILIAGFVIFEVFLNAGPHLITFVIPSRIFPIADRAAGTGIAAMFGKVGAVVGVFFMPMLLDAGGIILVLSVTIGVMLLGGLIGWVYGSKLQLTH